MSGCVAKKMKRILIYIFLVPTLFVVIGSLYNNFARSPEAAAEQTHKEANAKLVQYAKRKFLEDDDELKNLLPQIEKTTKQLDDLRARKELCNQGSNAISGEECSHLEAEFLQVMQSSRSNLDQMDKIQAQEKVCLCILGSKDPQFECIKKR